MKKLFGIGLVALMMMVSVVSIGAGSASAQDQATFPVTARFLNAMTAVDQINVYLNGADKDQRVIEGLKYGEVSEPVELTAPATNVLIKQVNDLGFDPWLFNTVVPSMAGGEYLIVISDFVLIPTQVDTAATADGSARVRLIHAAAQAPAVDVTVNGEAGPTNLRYGFATDAGELPAGSYDFQLLGAGTTTVALDLPGTALEAGKIYTFVAIGKPGSTEQPLTVVPVVSESK